METNDYYLNYHPYFEAGSTTFLHQNDTFACLGGDEFALVLPQINLEDAKIIASELNLDE